MKLYTNINDQAKESIKEARNIWEGVAKKYGWYTQPFYIQAWLHEDGTLEDCVSFKGISQDIILQAEIEEVCTLKEELMAIRAWEKYDD